jgi:hypothetical protein
VKTKKEMKRALEDSMEDRAGAILAKIDTALEDWCYDEIEVFIPAGLDHVISYLTVKLQEGGWTVRVYNEDFGPSILYIS